MKRRLFAFSLLFSACALSAAAAVTSFASATYKEVVNDVSTVIGSTGKETPAKPGETFTFSDIVRAGRASRAQLEMPDETLIRVGPNAVFSLDKSSRLLHLENGSVLFFAPPGAGGGTIMTDTVSCAVTGTTITVNKDEKNGNKVQVLEGECRMTILATGKVVILRAGKSGTLAPKATDVTITNFTPATMIGSILVSGFTSPLPSASKVVLALGGLPSATPAEIAAVTPPALPTARPSASVPNLTITSPTPVNVSPNGDGAVN